MANATNEVQASQFSIDRTHPGRWTITFSNPPINMFVPTTIVELQLPDDRRRARANRRPQGKLRAAPRPARQQEPGHIRAGSSNDRP